MSVRGETHKKKLHTYLVFLGLLFFGIVYIIIGSRTMSAQNIFQDSDQDGLSNDEERLYGTDPFNKDTDGDSYGDGVEVESGYNPVKPAPGDKIVKDIARAPEKVSQDSAENLTEKVSMEVASMLENSSGGMDISVEDMDESVRKVLAGTNNDVTLPIIDVSEIKIKNLSKKLKGKERDEREREDAIEYLTVVSYLVANNAPRAFQTDDEMSSLLNSVTSESVSALMSGNLESIHQLSTRGEKMLGELRMVEVPEKMLDLHIKALQMATYAMQLKDELKPTQDDPLGQIAVLTRAQGLFGIVAGFVDEVHQKLADYDIQEIPLNL